MKFVDMTYREIISDYIKQNGTVRGYKAALSKAGKFQQSFLNQVLSSSAHLTPDQAFSISEFFDLNTQQTEYFITRVILERATSSELKKHLEKKISQIREFDSDKQSESLPSKYPVEYSDILFYFSSWEPSAICSCLELESMSGKDISQALGLSEKQTQAILQHLRTMNIVEKLGDQWKCDPSKKPNINDYPTLHHLFRNVVNVKVVSMMHQGRSLLNINDFYALTPSELEAFKAFILPLLNKPDAIETSQNQKIVVGISLNAFAFS